MALVPASVAEQIGIVFVFCILILSVIYAISKLLNSQRQAQLESQQALLKQQQTFIADQYSKWQDFMNQQSESDIEQRREDRGQLSKVVVTLDNLCAAVSKLNEDFNVHIAEDEARFDVLLTDDQKVDVKKKSKR